MNYLIAVYTGSKIHTLTLKLETTSTIGNTQADSLCIADAPLGSAYLTLSCEAGGVRVLSRKPMNFRGEEVSNRVMSAGEIIAITDKISLAVFVSKCDATASLSLEELDEITIGRSFNSSDICLKDSGVSSRHAIIKKENGRWFLTDPKSSNGTFINDELVPLNTPTPAENMNIFISGYIFYIQKGILTFTNTPGEIEFSPEITPHLIQQIREPKHYPFFQRSPRLRARPESQDFEILPPPNAGTKPAISWLSMLLPPFMMVFVMGGVAVMMKNYTMLIYSLPMSLMSVVVSIANYKNNMKKWQKTSGLAIDKYNEHLAEREAEITKAEGAYISALSSSSPGVHECMALAQSVSRQLWERTIKDADFLSVRLGTGDIPSNVEVKIPHAQLSVEDNPFLKQAEELRDRHLTLKGVPVCHSLMSNPITGISGQRDNVIKTAWRIVLDIAAHHSYDDIRIVCVYPPSEKRKWDWMRWLPHVWDPSRSRRYLTCEPEESRFILRETAEILKIRRRDAADHSTSSKKDGPEKPFYVVILADKSLADSCGEQFLPENSSLGFAALYAYGDLGLLPAECQSVISCDSPSFIQNTRPDARTRKISYTPDEVRAEWLDEFARSLAPVRLIQTGAGSSLPSKISFLQGFNVTRVNELDVLGRWGSSYSPDSLAVPIGIRENGDTFFFDVYEKAMGPHGVTAGTSGSGKSEMLTTWLLSMALTFSPEDVNFALIEFKGNDLSNILKGLPHVAGVISNLNDPSTIVRGLKSLKGEKDRRMRLFEQCNFLSSKSISAYQSYQKMFGERDGLAPLPYLIIVIDEFAELVTQFPEFNDEIISIARVGRSVGMYMVLTMQSPQGVVKGQVSSNTKFKICLRTANTSESKEILGTDDAFNISAPGRAYVKVGNNEVYEQVQTFYSKAPYRPEAGSKGPVREIKLVLPNGSRKRPDFYEKTTGKNEANAGEGVAVSNYIIEEANAHDIVHARPVWKEPLSGKIILSELIADKMAIDLEAKTWTEKNKGLSVTVGLIDNPEKQDQYPLVLDFVNDGHQVLYGAPSTGKTTFLQTLLLSAAMTYTPDQVNFLILDYGSFILKVFDALPHTIITADPTDDEKLAKARDFLQDELSSRRKLFSSLGVANLQAYRETSGKVMPAIIVAADNMSSLSGQNSDLMNLLVLAARDGASLGIYLMLTAGNPGSYMYKISNFVKSNHTLQMNEKSDYKTLVGGDGKMTPGKVKGRGLTSGALEYQTALFADGASEAECSQRLKDTCALLAESWQGRRASLAEAEAQDAAPVESGELAFSEGGVQIGITKKGREPVNFSFRAMNGCIISGTYGGGKSSILGMIAQALGRDEKTKVYVYEEKPFIETLCPNAKTVHTIEEADAMILDLADEFDKRDEDSEGRIALLIDDFYMFYQDISQKSADILESIAQGGLDRNMYLYITCSTKGLSKFGFGTVKLFKALLAGGNAIVTGGRLGEYQAFKSIHPDEDISFGKYEGCMIHDNKITVVRFAKPEGV